MLRNARKQDRRCCNTVAQCWMMPDKTRMRMPAKSLNRPQRSNVSAAKDNNNIHRFPAAVNRSAQHRPHRTRSSRHTPRYNGDRTADRNRPPPPFTRMYTCPTDTAFARPTQPLRNTNAHMRGLRRENHFLIYCAKIGRMQVLRLFGGGRKCAGAAAGRGRDGRGGGRAARARGGREMKATILKCGNFDKTSL